MPTTSTCRRRWPASRKPAPGPASRSRSYYPQVDGTFNAGWRGSSSDDANRSRIGHRERRLRIPALVGDRPVRQAAAAARSCARPRARERAEPPRRAGHADRGRGVHLLPAARTGPAARDRAPDAGAQRRDRRLLQEPARRRRIESPGGGPHRRQPRANGGRHSGNRAAGGACREPAVVPPRTRPRADHAPGAAAGRETAAAGTAGAADAVARAAARRRARRAAARRRQRRHRRRQGAVLPHAQPHGVSRRRQRRSRQLPGRRRGGVVAHAEPVPANLQCRTSEAERRGHAGALRRGGRRVPEGRA